MATLGKTDRAALFRFRNVINTDLPLRLFLTVGAQMPFDRLVKAVDDWAVSHPTVEIFAQIGNTTFRPSSLDFVAFIEPDEFQARMAWARVIVAHAGVGSILAALQLGKPILVMPRLGRLHETRNDHQVATAHRFRELANVAVATDELQLQTMLNDVGNLAIAPPLSRDASDQLVSVVRRFVLGTLLT